jgi:hypothetical protein
MKGKKENNDLVVGVVLAFVILALIVSLVWYFAGDGESDSNDNSRERVESAQQDEDIDIKVLVEDMNKTDLTLYYSETCSHCQDQIELFGDEFNNLENTVNCSKQADRCKVQYVPTWGYDSEEEVGVKSLSELRSIVDSLIK